MSLQSFDITPPKSFLSIIIIISARRVWAANNTELLVTGKVNLPFVLDSRCLRTFAIVTPDVEDVMLGDDWLQTHNCLWDFRNTRLYIDGQEAVPLKRRRPSGGDYGVSDVMADGEKGTDTQPKLPADADNETGNTMDDGVSDLAGGVFGRFTAQRSGHRACAAMATAADGGSKHR